MTSLTKLTASDLMRRDVTTLAEDATIEEALRIFEDERITGAPVVDVGGRVVGVLSARDIANRQHVRDDRIETERGDDARPDPFDEGFDEPPWAGDLFFAKEDYSSATLGRESVRDWMTPRAIGVPPDADLKTVCRTMAEESIHRVLVLDEGSLAGIVSASDVVRHLAESL